MGVVAYIDYLDEDNAGTMTAIEDDADPEPVTWRRQVTCIPSDLDPLEDTVYIFDADEDLIALADAVGVTPISADAFIPD